MTRGGGRPVAATLLAGLAAGLLALLALAGSTPAAAASRDSTGGSGVAVVIGCVQPAHGKGAGHCGILLVVCGDDGRTVTSVTVLSLGTSGHGGLVVRVGGPCPGQTSTTAPPTAPPPDSPTGTPPTAPPASSPPHTPPPTSGAPSPPASSPPPTAAPSATGSTQPTGPTGAEAGAPSGPATGTKIPSPRAAAAASAPAQPSAAPAPGALPPSSAPVSLSFAAVAPATPPFGDRQAEDATRWWLLSVLVVLLPAALSAAFPRSTGRHT